MNRKLTWNFVLATFLVFPVVGFAEEEKKEEKKDAKEEWHCEKKDGDIKADSKDDCKKKGGKWKKEHGDHGGHKHE